MKKSIAAILAFTLTAGTAVSAGLYPISAEETGSSAVQTAEQDPVRVRYQYLLTRGREEVLKREPLFEYVPDYIGFDILDVTGDGVEDLVMRRKDEHLIYVFDTDKNVRAELSESSVFYPNGIAASILKNTRGLSKNFTAFTLYGYREETNRYELIGSVEGWEKSFAPVDKQGNPFPDDLDTAGKGMVYFINDADHDPDTPVSHEEFANWKAKHYGSLTSVKINYKDLTQKNIDNIDTTLKAPAVTEVTTVTTLPETTTVTSTSVTTTTPPVTTVTTTAATTTVTTTAATTKAVTTTVATTVATTAATTTVTTVTTPAVTTTVTTEAPKPVFENQKYDIDDNGVINTCDIIKLMQIIVDPANHKTHEFHGDIDYNGYTDVHDLMNLKNFISKF